VKNNYKKRILISLIVLAALLGGIKLAADYFSIPFYTYPGFGIKIPPGNKLLGIDISHHQDKINWKQVSEMSDLGKKVNFVFMKATQGNYLTDNQFKRNWSEAKDYEIDRGAYLFFDPRRNGEAQARYFINRVKLTKGDFAPVIDFEDLYSVSKAKARKEFKACANLLKRHYGIQPILYTYSDFYRQNLNEDFEQYPLWIAHYKSYGKPRIDHDYYFWQFSDQGRMNGIKGNVDFNVSDRSESSLNELRLGLN
jgi:lysozyme